MDPTALKQFVDSLFATLIAREAGHPVLQSLLTWVKSLVDAALPSIAPQLEKEGFKLHK